MTESDGKYGVNSASKGLKLSCWSPDLDPEHVNEYKRVVCVEMLETAPAVCSVALFNRKRSMDFQKLCTFETFKEFWSHYGYGENLQDVIEQEFTRTKGNVSVQS